MLKPNHFGLESRYSRINKDGKTAPATRRGALLRFVSAIIAALKGGK